MERARQRQVRSGWMLTPASSRTRRCNEHNARRVTYEIGFLRARQVVGAGRQLDRRRLQKAGSVGGLKPIRRLARCGPTTSWTYSVNSFPRRPELRVISTRRRTPLVVTTLNVSDGRPPDGSITTTSVQGRRTV